MTNDSSRPRRYVLQLAGTITAGMLAGCTGFLPFSSSNQSVIEDVNYQGEQAVVHLKDGSNADTIEFRNPNDKLRDSASIGQKSDITFYLLKDPNTPLSPGEYTLVAVNTEGDESETISTHQLELTSSFSIEEVRPVKERMQSDFTTNPPKTDGTVEVSIQNTGTLPAKITYIGIPDGVPDPDDPPSAQGPAAYQTVQGNHRLPTLLPVDEQLAFESVATPLGYYQPAGQPTDQSAIGEPEQGASWEQIKETQCNGQQHPATVVVVPEQGSTQRLSVTFKYGGETVRGQSFATDYECTNVTVTNMETATNTTTDQ